MGADPSAAMLLVGMGLRTLSMSSVSIPNVKSFLLAHTLEEAESIAANALKMTSSSQVTSYIADRFSL
jgi:phosphoenolpyruvate-protein kinase (PTS system EI component)